MSTFLFQNVPEGVQIPLGYVVAVVSGLVTAVVTLFLLLMRTKDQTNKEVQAEKEKRLRDAIEHERLVSELKQKIARMKGVGDADS